MKFLILLLVTLPDTALTSRSITGWEGGSVSIQCDYDQYYKDHKKYWCKGKDWSACIIQRNEDKVSISDNKTQGVFTVTVRRLEKGDEDQYWCAIETMFYDINIPVYLKVADGERRKEPPRLESDNNKGLVTTDVSQQSPLVIPLVTGGLLVLLGSVLISIRKMKARADNPWRCDCALHWLRSWINEEGQRLLSSAERRLVCAEPPRLSHHSLVEVPGNSLVCIPPVVQLEPKHLTMRLGENVRVSCQASGYPQPLVTWRKVSQTKASPKVSEEEGRGGTMEPSKGVRGERFDPDTGSGMLFLSNLTVAHMGEFILHILK
ncbi:UNVERIFIED_CONTAM: hypothetical protein FKN15_027709 [Acipenser sinensis]